MPTLDEQVATFQGVDNLNANLSPLAQDIASLFQPYSNNAYQNYTDVYKNNRITSRIPFMRATASSEEVRRFRLETGDVIITKDSESWTDIGVPSLVEYEPNNLVCGYHLAILRPCEGVITGAFLLYASESQEVMRQYHIAANGVTRYGLTYRAIKNIQIPVPPLVDQRKITRFLDYTDRHIRRYIRSRQKLISLLNEQKQAIIDQAVTRGLDPNVRLKPSGVDWLGDVPGHWEVVPVRSLMTFRKQLVGEQSKNTKLLSLTLRGIIPRDLDNPTGKFPSDFSTYQVVEPENLVFCLFDMDETPRTVGIARERGMITGAYSVFKCVSQDVAEFLYQFFLSMDITKRFRPFYTGLRKVVTKNTLLNLKIALPPSAERREIVSHICRECALIDEAVKRLEEERSAVEEFRMRVISDVVTGKWDVQEVAARLPNGSGEKDESDWIDEVEDDSQVEAMEELPEDGLEPEP